ncbi:unnamed protein product [Adineta steineri]|uniref:Uncharacterized protein n=1 Tax=Adineta steineri TaxID=433720 RepID=A0A814LEU8_9BILA|nr:unnamed protein product [Adineta steineri]CAF1169811.1 unnamed protein product [Adineta steineri]
MQYENFSRHLRQKYSTCLHVADQLADQLKQNSQSKIIPTSVHELHNQNMLKAQQEISFPLISYLNNIECVKTKSIENNQEYKPYFNECILLAQRIKNNRHSSNRDRQICYENLILTQKLERIKKQSGKKDYKNHCHLLLSKVNSTQNHSTEQINQTTVEEEESIDSSEEKFSGTIVRSHSSSEHEDDQATAADVDATMNSCHSKSTVTWKKRKIFRNNCIQINDNRIYQHLNNIDMTMIRDTMPLSTSRNSKHFSICVLPRFESMDNHSKVVLHDQKSAFKREILYH